MSGALRRGAPLLRKLGYSVEFVKDTDKKRNRLIELRAPVELRQEPSAPSEPSNTTRHRAFQADGSSPQSSEQPSISKTLNNKPADGTDGSDGGAETLEEAAWTL